ncbi:MAG: hypothetical protein MRY83_18700 [Flavobacteriales bacterium]|nr:hypothetical protein [Flavobacteriales bacterium]
MDRLVKQLSTGYHPIIFEPRTGTYKEVKERLLETGFVFFKFLDTIGETELGLNVDPALTNIGDAEILDGIGTLCVVGTCELNFHKVKCIADVNLQTRHGMACLELL